MAGPIRGGVYRPPAPLVMAGLVPAIHVFAAVAGPQDVGTRHETGDDGEASASMKSEARALSGAGAIPHPDLRPELSPCERWSLAAALRSRCPVQYSGIPSPHLHIAVLSRASRRPCRGPDVLPVSHEI